MSSFLKCLWLEIWGKNLGSIFLTSQSKKQVLYVRSRGKRCEKVDLLILFKNKQIKGLMTLCLLWENLQEL